MRRPRYRKMDRERRRELRDYVNRMDDEGLVKTGKFKKPNTTSLPKTKYCNTKQDIVVN